MTKVEKRLKMMIAHVAAQEKKMAENPQPFMAPRNEIDRQNALSWWFPKLQDMQVVYTELNLPRTHIITDLNWEDLCQSLDSKESKTLGPLVSSIIQIIEKEFAWPAFMRTDYASHKHGWEGTCFLQRPDQVGNHILMLLNDTCMAFGLCLKDLVIREYIPMQTAFTAFHGHMPINTEFRFFVQNHEITHLQPYWPSDAFDERAGTLPDDWQDQLMGFSQMDKETHSMLSTLAIGAGAYVGPENEWSVDFSLDKKGTWWLIDMARGERSYRWKPDFEVVIRI